MNKYNAFNIVFLLVFSLSSNTAFADRKDKSGESDDYLGDIAAIIEGTIVEVVDRTVDKAKDVVRENTGIDLERRGYSRGRDHKPLPQCASDKARRELNQLQGEYNREISKLEEELDRKLDKAEAEFKREAAKEDKAEKVYEKRGKLEKKVDEAYAKFDEKVDKHNRKYDEKRDSIVNKGRGSDRCKNARDRDDRDEDRSERRGRDDRDEDRSERRGRDDRDEHDRVVPNHTRERGEHDRVVPDRARERADDSQASDVAREESAAHSEAEEKKWWRFWE